MPVRNVEYGPKDDLVRNVGLEVEAEAVLSFEQKTEATTEIIMKFIAVQLANLSAEEILGVSNRVGQLTGDIYWEAHKRHVLGIMPQG